MTATKDFLLEIGTEELPPKALPQLSAVLETEVLRGLTDQGLTFGAAKSYATPRRLAVQIDAVLLRQEDKRVERRGPAVSAAFDADGNPTKAALGFAKSCGIDIDAVGRLKTDKGEWLAYTADVPGENADALLPAVVEKALSRLPIPKPMRWGSSATEFVRPVHWIVLMLGDTALDASILGIQAGTTTVGHRFHAPDRMTITAPKDYSTLLSEKGRVIADFGERRSEIRRLTESAADLENYNAIIDNELLSEVAALVEWPVPIVGSFDEHFLALPREVLIASMQDHQKYFPVESRNGELVNRFITISNIESEDPDAVRAGNERVIRPRLSDANFFWQQDRKSALQERRQRLNDIIFEKRLGSLGDKTQRTAQLAERLAPSFNTESASAKRAAELSRCDLVSEMVGEFPELQGIMGGYYAQLDGEAPETVSALREFYMPRFAGDDIPASPTGRCVSYADKIDTLLGIFAIGSAPTGDKDPYALRRAALGCARIALESNSNVGLTASLHEASAIYGNEFGDTDTVAEVHRFILDRLRGYFADRDVPGAVVDAVLDVQDEHPADIARRVNAVVAFKQLPQSETLAAANKRIANILRKSGVQPATDVSPDLLVENEERQLADELQSITESSQPMLESGDYESYLVALAELHRPIDAFFDAVMVMCDDVEVRDNRLALLNRVRNLFSQVANIARLND